MHDAYLCTRWTHKTCGSPRSLHIHAVHHTLHQCPDYKGSWLHAHALTQPLAECVARPHMLVRLGRGRHARPHRRLRRTSGRPRARLLMRLLAPWFLEAALPPAGRRGTRLLGSPWADRGACGRCADITPVPPGHARAAQPRRGSAHAPGRAAVPAPALARRCCWAAHGPSILLCVRWPCRPAAGRGRRRGRSRAALAAVRRRPRPRARQFGRLNARACDALRRAAGALAPRRPAAPSAQAGAAAPDAQAGASLAPPASPSERSLPAAAAHGVRVGLAARPPAGSPGPVADGGGRAAEATSFMNCACSVDSMPLVCAMNARMSACAAAT